MERAKFESFVGRFAKFLKPRNRGIESEAGSCERVWALEEIQEVNSSGQIGQLYALRFKMQSVKFNSSLPNREQNLENEMAGTRQGIPNGETFNKYGGAARKVGIDAIGEHGDFERMSLGNSGRGL